MSYKKMMKNIMAGKTDEEIKEEHKKRLDLSLGGGEFAKVEKI